MNEPVLRRACDRCHAQKLSCQSNNNESCERCLRVSAQCTKSPSLRNRRHRRPLRADDSSPPIPKRRALACPEPSASNEFGNTQSRSGGTPTPTPTVQNNGPDGPDGPGGSGGSVHELDMAQWASVGHFPEIPPFGSDLDGSSLFPNLFDSDLLSNTFLVQPLEFHSQDLGTSATKSHDALRRLPEEPRPTSTMVTAHVPTPTRTSPGNDSGTTLAGSSDDNLTTSSTQTSSQATPRWLQTLVEINVHLFRLASNKDNQVDASPDADSSSSSNMSPFGNGFDEILLLAQRLLRALCALYGRTPLDRDARGIGLLEKSWVPRTNLDTGSTLIILSCHVRLIELLMDRLVKIMDIISGTKGPLISYPTTAHSADNNERPIPLGPALPLPTLTAFTCSLDDFPILKLRITLELIEHTLDMLRRALAPLVSHSVRGTTTRHSQGDSTGKMSDFSEKLLSARDEAAYELIANIRKKLNISRNK
ncbi:hypothetical protein F4777DRAFT_124931 [Nemania sp. FL0916]|nr:hypothetical protein F4777DRAFT_124931 [Nemania sp. FL0916]